MKAVAIILAAGASTRMGFPKAALPLGGETFLQRQRRVFSEAGVDVLVVGPGAIENPDPSRGMFSSLQCGLAAAEGAAVILFTPVDVPGFTVDTVRALLACDTAPVVVPTYRGKGGHPVRIRGEIREALLRAEPNSITRDELGRFRLAHLAVEDAAVLQDVDTPSDYAALQTGASE